MLSTLRNAWKVPELRKRMIFTIMMVVLFRMGNFIPVPGIDSSKIGSQLANSKNLLNFYDLISGGAFSSFSIFAMGVTPYINASIIIQLLTVAIPRLEQLSKEGQDGRKKIQNYTRYSSIIFALVEALGMYYIIGRTGAILDTSKFNMFLVILTMTTASVFLVWLGEQITARGIGNGVSMIIFVNIISRFPNSMSKVFLTKSMGGATFVAVTILLAGLAAMLLMVIVVNLSERRIPVQYAGKAAGGKMFKGQSTHIPINISSSSVISIIFAMSVMRFPITIADFAPNTAFAKFVKTSPYSIFRENTWQYAVVYAVLIIFFTVFYTQITFKPDEMSENMHKSSGFIPGIRPGEPTTMYLESVLNKMAVLGGLFASIIAIFPILIEAYSPFKQISLGGTALLIVVGVAVETMRQLESQLVMRHYQGFLK
ncbi:preprotein translocase subunit SecY [Hathewaya massiliensis]|uniref:preprotein translocase subunit SecY n=1 Tax=Hathewaya massiliensis TaxID=1964382 RepID=UPI0011573E39|nr:preprotein translocase subunit SecY [Hathewaya massiliensis]